MVIGRADFKYWNKNYQHMCEKGRQHILRHQLQSSYGPPQIKFGCMIGEFTRILRHTTRNEDLTDALMEKEHELRHVGFSRHTIRRAVNHVGKRRGSSTMAEWRN